MQEALRRIEEAKNSNTTELDLSKLNLKAIPDSIAQLSNLLDLDLSQNEITAIPKALTPLSKIQRLALDRNQIINIPDSFADLSNLRNVDLRVNQITAVPEVLARLSNLQNLDLSSNQITAIPDSFAGLSNLESLDFSDNQITAIPDSLAQLSNLKSLTLGGNQITAIPDSLAQLFNLQSFNLGDNQITAIPDSLAQLFNLQDLYLYENQITAIPDSLAQLSNLQILDLNSNQITAIPDSLAQLSELRTLYLGQNQITAIPDSFAELSNLQILSLEANPLPEELFAALKQGIPSFFRYLKSTAKGSVYPRTIKLVLLGEPKSGKTTLLEALKGNLEPCDESRQETLGVDVVTIEKLSPADSKPMYLSAWDFAGQHIEHATHQFFLTENAIYLILWNSRQGTEAGKRDLWYWLELLKMRVREPKFLLVATHTEHTPPDLNLSEIEKTYAGYQGHFPIDLKDLKGFAELQAKILELASNSPSLHAPWPADWLTVRDEVRKVRQTQPHMTPAAFHALMKKNKVAELEAQKDLAGQLHNLGEILYFHERDELCSLVILNPELVTELIALVVRSKEVRQHNGILRKADLDRLWKKYKLQAKVRNHLIHLMDWFDLTYSTSHPTELGIVVEALPYSTPDNRKQIDLDAEKPQMEMIFRFPSLQRRLPPGIPTWGIARAHRFSKCTPWRDAAAFEDTDTKSQALILASDTVKEIRLRVAADYPPFFLGRMEAILQDTFKRYAGAKPERHLPCPCQPGCTTSYLFEMVLKRWNDRKPFVNCGRSGEDIFIETLLSGARRTDTAEGFHALQSEIRRQHTEQLRAQNEQMEKTCPSVFTLVPTRDFKMLDTLLESVTQSEELELALYCEYDVGWHPTAHSLYRFRLDQKWFDSVKKNWNSFLKVTKRVGSLAKTVGKASGVTWPVVETADMVLEKMPEASRATAGKFSEMLGDKTQPGFIDLETRHLLQQLIENLDKDRPATEARNGGLYRYIIDDGRLLWLCPEHLNTYKTRG